MESIKSRNNKGNEIYKMLDVKIKKEVRNNPKILINYIKDIDETYIKILFFLYFCDNLDRIDVDYLTDAVSGKNIIGIEKITEALNFWRDKKIIEYKFNNADEAAGVINTDNDITGDEIQKLPVINITELKKKNTTYPIDKISETLETKEEFRNLIYIAQIKFQSIFNPNELGVLFGLYEINKVDIDLLLKLTDICVLEDKANVVYLEKIAIGLSSNGILTVDDYEKNYNETLKIKDLEEKILKIFKIQDHKFTTQEKIFIKKWALEFGFSDDILEEGYNICMGKLFELNFRYINGIFSKWHEKDFSTLEDIRAEFNKAGGFRATKAKSSSFNIDSFFEKAVQKAMMSDD